VAVAVGILALLTCQPLPLTSGALRAAGYFDPVAVDGLVRRCLSGRATGVAESQALVAILSTQIWHHRFIKDASPPARLNQPDVVLLEETAAESSDAALAPSYS
jgi:hypothetical protein